MKISRLAMAMLAAAAFAPSVQSDDKDFDLKVGDKAPTFTSLDDQGKEWKSADHVGKKIVVVYFYPADMTGGCTKQACGFRDDMAKLSEKGIEVIGVSGDSVKNHQVFKTFHKLNFTLLADENGAIAKKFGVPLRAGGTFKTKDAEGNPVELIRGVTALRWTFVIGKDGKIAYKNTKVNAPEDAKVIAKVVSELEK
jgi:peroxiredoxin Q/BCP